MRPRAENRRFRKASIARLSNTPVGTAPRERRDSVPMTPRRNGARRNCAAARQASAGSAAARRRNSPNAGFRKISGFSAASAPSSMKSRYICAGEMPFASAAATNPPDDTPT